MENKPKKEKQGSVISLDNITKILTTLIAVSGFIWGIIKFQSEQRTNERLEFSLKLWEKKLDTYNKLSDITGSLIINRNDTLTFDSLQSRFEFLYYSSMVMVEDTIVEKYMIQFSTAINDYKLKRKSEMHLKLKALELMKEIAVSLKKRQELLFDKDE